MLKISLLLPFVVLTGFVIDSTCAGDWPQILGPNRDGIAEAETLTPEWPSGGPHSELEIRRRAGLRRSGR